MSFAGWLAKHLGMVSQLSISHNEISCNTRTDAAALLETAKQIVQFAVTTAAAAASAAGAPLHLCAYTSLLPVTTGVLAALPAATLTRLDVSIDSGIFSAEFSKLSSLQRLGVRLLRTETSDSCLQGLGKLTQLTQLSLYNVANKSNMQLLPTQLQRLELQYTTGPTSSLTSAAKADLQHLTCLRHLKLEAVRLAAGSSLPSNLLSLDLEAQFPAEGVIGLGSLHQVTSMVLEGCGLRRSHVQELQQLTQLIHLSLGMRVQPDERPMEVAAAWHQLPLCDLRLTSNLAKAAEVQQLMRHIAEATKLTGLQINISKVANAEAHGLAVCEHLKSLQQLRSLDMCIDQPQTFKMQDAQHLSALTALTSMDLCYGGCGPGVDASTLCLLAVSLTQLRVLSIGVDSDPFDPVCLASVPALPVLGKLTTLETLCVGRMSRSEAQRGLQFLTGLSRLNVLDGFHEAGAEAMAAFWATVKSRHVQQ